MSHSTITLTAFRHEHLASAMRLSQQAKWPHRLDDWQMAVDLSTGEVAVDSDATVLGTVLMTPYSSGSRSSGLRMSATGLRCSVPPLREPAPHRLPHSPLPTRRSDKRRL
jgi:hypothetical protein